MREKSEGYSPVVMDHFIHPRNMGEMKNPDGVGEVQNPVCGDTMRLFIKVEGDRIVDAKFLTFGCSAAIASSSMACGTFSLPTCGEGVIGHPSGHPILKEDYLLLCHSFEVERNL